MDGNELNIWKVFKFFNEGEFEKLILTNKVLKSYEIFNEKISLNEFRNYDRFGDVLMIDKMETLLLTQQQLCRLIQTL